MSDEACVLETSPTCQYILYFWSHIIYITVFDYIFCGINKKKMSGWYNCPNIIMKMY